MGSAPRSARPLLLTHGRVEAFRTASASTCLRAALPSSCPETLRPGPRRAPVASNGAVALSPPVAAPVHILIVDDDPDVLESAHRMLGNQGFVTATAFDGPGALQVDACLGPFEMLIAAMEMPDMAGPELAQRIRLRQPNLKVVYLTSAAQPPPVNASPSTDGDCALAKSSTVLDRLTQVVASLLAPSAASDPHLADDSTT